MPSTTVHLPPALLENVDVRAREQGVSRNRFIIRALEHAIERDESWSSEFLAELRGPVSPGDAAAVDGMLDDIVSRRTRKPSPEL